MNARLGFQTGAIHIIESLPPGELRTGERLRDVVEPLAQTTTPAIDVYFSRPQTRDDFLGQLANIGDVTANTGRLPLVHIEAHGTGEGLELARGDQVTWSELKVPLIRLNVLSRLNLVVVTGACEGVWLLHVVDTTDRAPLWGLVGARRRVLAGEVEDAYSAFYRALFATLDGGQATREMNCAIRAGDSPFLFAGAVGLFRDVIRGYFNELCTPEAIETRAARLVDAARRAGLNEQGLRGFEAGIRQHLGDLRTQFAQIKSRFFFVDLCPENENRFPINFEDCWNGDVDRSLEA